MSMTKTAECFLAWPHRTVFAPSGQGVVTRLVTTALTGLQASSLPVTHR
jgi:hypothetical protein